ncbi:flagellar biosynthetic protein FliO [Carnobacterium sp. TMP28]|uniref:flagellar biosynthetic protein FliO n=1 Tax=Carnobacterium sp. TMP28 TaxID=3397060 RepID=UPI0039DFEB9B
MELGVGLGYVVKSIVALVVIIFIANYSLKYLNTFMTKKGKAIRIIERTAINKNSSICIVEIAGTYYVMSFTETHNEILRELNDSEKEAIIQTQEVDVSNLTSPNPLNSNLTHWIKQFQTRYQNFYEKRK